jgi:CheY-like chemotaxis protein
MFVIVPFGVDGPARGSAVAPRSRRPDGKAGRAFKRHRKRFLGATVALGQMGGAGDTVLVVDDDESLRMLCRVNLELEGYRVLEAPTVELAESLLRDEAVDVVLLDVHVGSGDGFKVLGEVSGERVALFTGSFDVDEHHAAAVDAVLRKPFTLTELSETVGRLAQS